MSMTPRLMLPFIVAGQAQKEVTHNEALQRLDLLVQSACVAGPSNTPPAGPEYGDCFICGGIPTGPWAGQPNALAQWTSGGWRFAAPSEGMKVAAEETGLDWHFFDEQWSQGIVRGSEIRLDGVRVVGPRLSAIPGAEGGTVIDVQARTTLAAVLAALETHGLIAAG